MIIAISGALGSGKAAIAKYLQDKFGFKIFSMYEAFALASNGKPEVTDEVLHAFFDSTVSKVQSHVVSNTKAVDELYKKVLVDLKADWRSNHVVYPFLPSQEMAQYM